MHFVTNRRFNPIVKTPVPARAVAPATVLSRQETRRIVAELLG